MRNFAFKRFTTIIILTLLLSASISPGFCQSGERESETNSIFTVQIDGSKRYQEIDGFGVNANTASWNGTELELVLDLLIDSLNATIWRVIVEPEERWEESNDNDDPFQFNWTYYNALYETPKFQKAWNMIDYLNRRGIDEGIMINLMGRVPAWMGKEVIKPECEDEFVEMLVSFLHYGRNVRHLKFGLMSPMNEPDIKNEGPTVGALQYARILRKIIERMEIAGLGDIGIVAPDVASMKRAADEYIPAMISDPIIMSRLAYFGLHSYNGASAGLVWEAYDTVYEHPPGAWSYWGILGYDQNTGMYTPRKHFYTIAQFSKFVLPGSWRISASEPGNGANILAFYDDESGRLSIVGENTNSHAVTIQGMLKDLPEISYFELYIYINRQNIYKKFVFGNTNET